MALARHKAEGHSKRHWKRNHLFNSITGSHSRPRHRRCHLESRGGFTEQHTKLLHVTFALALTIQGETPPRCWEVMPHASSLPVVINAYTVREIFFLTCFPSLVPGGWFGVIDQRFRHGINKAFTFPLARARGSVMAHYAVQLFSNGTLEPDQDY